MKELEKIVDSNGEPLEIVDAEAREDISEIKQSLSVLTQTLYSTSYVKKQGNNVFINFGTDKIYNLINNVTIPSAFRPTETIRLPIIVNNTDNNTKYIGRVIIYNTGTLAFKYMSSYANEVDILTGSTWEVLTTVSYMI